jgi:hypothetical protein
MECVYPFYINVLQHYRNLGTVRALYPFINESTTMKNSLSITASALTIAIPATIFGGLVGIIPAAAFIGAVSLYATAGLLLVVLGDDGLARRPIVHRTPAPVCTPATFGPARLRTSYGIRRQKCTVA